MTYKTSLGLDFVTTNYLLQGRPGCGKTTLINILSRDWGNGRLLQSKLLFHVSLRQFKAQECRSLTTIIQQASPALAERDQSELIRFMKRDDDKNIVFALDGLDEYSIQQNMDEDIIFKLIKGRQLPNAVVIIISRPAACADFREIATREIEVHGFLQDQIKEYMIGQFQREQAQRLIDHLEQHPSLLNMCYLPLHCAMFVFLFDGDSILPTTETEFYEHYTVSTLLRSIRRRQSQVIPLSTYDQLPSEDKPLFSKVCKLAFEGAVESKYVFTRAAILQSIFKGDLQRTGNDESTLGLIVIDRYFMKKGLDETYTFLHRTHQEYLAAVHIARSHENLMEIVSTHGSKKHLSIVWRFLCGMLDYSKLDSIKIFDALIKSNDSLFRIQCAYESQDSQSCTQVVRYLEKNNSIEFTACGVNVSPSDFIALEYVVSKSNSSLGGDACHIMINCQQCKISVTGAMVLLKHVGEHQFSLELSKGDEAVKAFLDAFKLHPSQNLRELLLSENGIGPEGAQALGIGFELLQTSSLTTLSLGFNNIGDIGIQALQNGLKWCTGLKRLRLDNNKIGDTGAQTLAEGLQNWDNLKELTLSSNKIGDRGAQTLIDHLKEKHYNVLHTLGLYNNRITSSTVHRHLTYMINNFSKLELLEVGGHRFSEDAKKTLRETWKARNSDNTMVRLTLTYANK